MIRSKLLAAGVLAAAMMVGCESREDTDTLPPPTTPTPAPTADGMPSTQPAADAAGAMKEGAVNAGDALKAGAADAADAVKSTTQPTAP